MRGEAHEWPMTHLPSLWICGLSLFRPWWKIAGAGVHPGCRTQSDTDGLRANLRVDHSGLTPADLDG